MQNNKLCNVNASIGNINLQNYLFPSYLYKRIAARQADIRTTVIQLGSHGHSGLKFFIEAADNQIGK